MPEILVANEYQDVRCFGWVAPKKRQPLPRKEQLNPRNQDVLAEMWEKTDKQLAANRFPGQEGFKDKLRQMGTPMHSSALITKVQKLNPRLVAEDSTNCRGNAGFYYSTATGEKRFTGAHFRKGVLPEFSVIETDAADLPVRVQYGWREVLARLVKSGQLTLRQVVKAFGDTNTVQSDNWRREIQPFRG